ncbi:cytochrome c oxidase subunit 1 [Cichlidogyrus casuarinus]|uniref:Cytochrome c oxidase subunit 1 n=1 Tax=Cichlidogyrus casuarinus TaxID=1844966 RepID=A0ABD2PUG1_9PLAT
MSLHELRACSNKKAYRIKVIWPDGSHTRVECHSHSTVDEVLKFVRSRSSLGSEAHGWAIYEKFRNSVRCPMSNTVIGDILYRWENFARGNSIRKHVTFLMRKRLFTDYVYNELTHGDGQDLTEIRQLVYQISDSLYNSQIKMPNGSQTLVDLCAMFAICEFSHQLRRQLQLEAQKASKAAAAKRRQNGGILVNLARGVSGDQILPSRRNSIFPSFVANNFRKNSG